MAALSPLSASLASSASPASQSTTGTNSLNLTQNQFLQILTAQLQNQDPTNPVSATDFTTQLAEFSTVSGIAQLTSTMQQLVSLQQITQGAALIGKNVQYTQTGGTGTASGIVNSISINNGQLTLQVGTQSVPVGQVTAVLQTPGS